MGEADKPSFAVVGAGASGIIAAYQVQTRFPGASISVFEKNDSLGGTWYSNSYPGAACDVKSHLYQFSFDLNPNWSEAYSPQQEIENYFLDVVKRHEIQQHIQLNHLVQSAKYNAEAAEWALEVTNLSTGETSTHTARFLIVGPGALCRPLQIDTPGADDFLAAPDHHIFHSSRWRHDVDLTGKRVAVVGTGASAAQIVPAIVDKVQQLYVVQRTPAWILPRKNFVYWGWVKSMFARLPLLSRLYYSLLYWANEARFFIVFRSFWPISAVPKLVSSLHMRKQIKDPALLKLLTPDYPPGCKRLIISDDYLPALCRPNASLIPSALDRFTPSGIRTAAGQDIDVDIVVLAVGFDLIAGYPGFPVYGETGVALDERWRGDPTAYYGILVPGYPNLFCLSGPNTGLGHNSLLLMLECQVNYAMQCVQKVVEKKARSISVAEETNAKFNDEIQKPLKEHRVWSACKSWYNKQGERNFALWPHTVTSYWWRTRSPKWSDLVFGQ